jgi:hypothetical protein
MPFQVILTLMHTMMNAESRTATIMPVCPIRLPRRSGYRRKIHAGSWQQHKPRTTNFSSSSSSRGGQQRETERKTKEYYVIHSENN